MSLVVHSDPPPLRMDESGAIRVGTSRVLLELVIHACDDGATPEAVVQMYPTLDLADVYAVFAYYLRHRAEIQEYLRERDEQAQDIRRQLGPHARDMAEVRDMLLKRRPPHNRGGDDASAAGG